MKQPADHYAWATALCARSERCRSDLATKLRQRGCPADEARQLLDRLEDEGYIDEARYARAFVADKFRFDRWGRIKIRHQLAAKGISAAVIAEALDQIDDDEYLAALTAFITARLGRSEEPGNEQAADPAGRYALRQKVARAAINRGYEPHLVFDRLDIEGGE